MTARSVRIGGAIGYWGESPVATPQFLDARAVDYIVYDYLAEITLSIMARARAQDPTKGYATDFVTTVIEPNLPAIAAQGVKIVSNAGGMNPNACAALVRELVAKMGLDLRVAVVTGDDLYERRAQFCGAGMREMFTGEPLPPAKTVASVNAYLGAFPIALALTAGADIVITGRCVDSAVTLGICIHEFGWQHADPDLLSAGSLAGHLLECGPQATGGNYTDWDQVEGTLDEIGYPIARVFADGALEVSKCDGTGGAVTVGTVAEQLLYEIGDPQAYILPDVVCDFSRVSVHQAGPNRVRVTGASGAPAPAAYKVSLTAQDGFRGGQLLTFYGFDAEKKAQAFAAAVLQRARGTLARSGAEDFSHTSVEILGADSQFGSARGIVQPKEVVLKMAVRHAQASGVGVFLKTLAGLGLAAPPGLSGFAGARAKPTPLLKLYSFELPKEQVAICVDVAGDVHTFYAAPGQKFEVASIVRPPPVPAVAERDLKEVPLIALAWGRSGDKGDRANIGIIAREAHYLPYISAALTIETVAARFAHFLDGCAPARVQRFVLPGTHALNFVLHDVLGGGGMASLRNDPQGKGYAQILLEAPVGVPGHIARQVIA